MFDSYVFWYIRYCSSSLAYLLLVIVEWKDTKNWKSKLEHAEKMFLGFEALESFVLLLHIAAKYCSAIHKEGKFITSYVM